MLSFLICLQSILQELSFFRLKADTIASYESKQTNEM